MRLRLKSRLFVAALAVVVGPRPARSAAAEGDTDADTYDPLLDRPAPPPVARRTLDPRAGRSGFFIGGGGFGYFGSVRSVLMKEESRLNPGAFPGVLITLGGRAHIPLEFGLDIGYGLGRRWEAQGDGQEGWVWAHDLLIEPRLLWHLHETEGWDFVGGAAASNWMFDVGADGVSQYLLGPFAVAGVRRHLDSRSLLFLDVSGGWGKDYLAYVFEPPGKAALLENPHLPDHRVTGAWFPLVRVSAGYRLSGF